MSAGMPELGSKISLISKADIRYEGRLFTVDPQECTIALANVRSFGTEDRAAEFPIAPQSQVYDYILFRGSDIKDIRVVNNVGPLPNDPAIVQLSVPGTLGSSTYHQTPGFSHPVLGPMGPGLTQYPTYGAMGAMTGLPSAVAPGLSLHRDPRTLTKQPSELVTPIQVPEPTNKDQDLISGSSRSATPSLIARKSPTMDQGVQVSQPGSTPIKDEKKQQAPPSRQIQPPHPARDGPISRGTIGQQQYQPQPQREPRDREQREQQNREQVPFPQRSQPAPLRGGWVNRGGMRRGRGRGGNGGYNRQQGTGQQPTGTNGKPKNALKFESDYDFESANEEFDKVRNELAKTKIGDGKVNDDNEKKDDSGNETGAGEGEQEEEPQVFYDRSKSFFDNISCEAVERSKGRSQRTDWRTERKLNSETFGVASARRGGYRGRGYYGPRGMGGMYRGNFRGGFRGQGGRGRGNNPNGIAGATNNSQQRTVIQQSK